MFLPLHTHYETKGFAFSHPFWDKVFAFTHPFWDKVFAFPHLFLDKVFPIHSPKNRTWENEKWKKQEQQEQRLLLPDLSAAPLRKKEEEGLADKMEPWTKYGWRDGAVGFPSSQESFLEMRIRFASHFFRGDGGCILCAGALNFWRKSSL